MLVTDFIHTEKNVNRADVSIQPTKEESKPLGLKSELAKAGE